MNAKVARAVDAYHGITLFLRHHKITEGRFGTALATLERCVVDIRALWPAQQTAQAGRVYDGVSHRTLRATIRQDYMIPIARDGRSHFRLEPAILKALRVPHAKANDAELVAAARAMAKALAPHKKLFTEMGYPNDFLKGLRAVTKELGDWATHTAKTKERRTAANTQARHTLRDAKDAAAVIDGLMLSRTRGDPTLAKLWKSARHVPKRRGRPRAAKRAQSPTQG